MDSFSFAIECIERARQHYDAYIDLIENKGAYACDTGKKAKIIRMIQATQDELQIIKHQVKLKGL